MGGARQRAIRASSAIVAGLITLVVFRYVGEVHLDDFGLDLGRVTTPARKYTYYLGMWFFFGTIASALLALGIAMLLSGPRGSERLAHAIGRIPDWLWMVAVGLIAFAIPVAIRVHVLQAAPLTDDESPYRFMAQLLASGRLWVESHPIPDAFDRKFMINDGKMYSQYFLGWPALMMPGVWIGQAQFMNAVYSGLTVVPLFLVVRRACGSTTAKLTSLVLIGAPMLMIGAATEMAHTTCLAALAWLHLAVVRSSDEDAPMWSHFAVAALFGVMFFNRPTSAIGGGTPLLVFWLIRTWRRPPGPRMAAMTAFSGGAALFGGAFLAVNYLQNGSATQTAYGRAIEFAHEIDYKHWGGPKREGVRQFFRAPTMRLFHVLATSGFRLNFALFGWPCSFLFALFAVGNRHARLAWASLAGVFAVHVFVRSVGVDSFGPVKYFEAGWPIMVLTGIGLRRATDYLAALRASGENGFRNLEPSLLPSALLIALLVTSTFGYTRVRLEAVRSMAEKINLPLKAIGDYDLHNAVVFAPRNWARKNCSRKPVRHFVFMRPNNDPDLLNDVLWANSRSRSKNLELMEYFPEREPYMMKWGRDCVIEIRPLGAKPEPRKSKSKRKSTSKRDPSRKSKAIPGDPPTRLPSGESSPREPERAVPGDPPTRSPTTQTQSPDPNTARVGQDPSGKPGKQ